MRQRKLSVTFTLTVCLAVGLLSACGGRTDSGQSSAASTNAEIFSASKEALSGQDENTRESYHLSKKELRGGWTCENTDREKDGMASTVMKSGDMGIYLKIFSSGKLRVSGMDWAESGNGKISYSTSGKEQMDGSWKIRDNRVICRAGDKRQTFLYHPENDTLVDEANEDVIYQRDWDSINLKKDDSASTADDGLIGTWKNVAEIVPLDSSRDNDEAVKTLHGSDSTLKLDKKGRITFSDKNGEEHGYYAVRGNVFHGKAGKKTIDGYQTQASSPEIRQLKLKGSKTDVYLLTVEKDGTMVYRRTGTK